MIRERRFQGSEQAAKALALFIAERLTAAIARRGKAILAVSGGRSPATVFDALRSAPLDWAKLIIVQVDERWVPACNNDSNSQLINKHLLQGAATAAHFVPMKNSAPDPYTGQPICEAMLAALPRPFNVILLGMGEDGHTASLFPEAHELTEGLTTQALSLAVTPPSAPHQRMSLSLTGLLDSQLIIIQIAGSGKEDVYRQALGDGPVENMPIRAVLRQSTVPVEVWISDQ